MCLIEKKIPNVLIIIPVYKVEKYIQELLDSILQLNRSNYNPLFIFVDDCSPQNESEIIAAWMKENNQPAQLIRTPENLGLAGARNYGYAAYLKLKMEAVNQGSDYRCDYIIWMDSDDIFTVNSITWRVEFMENNPDIGFGYGSYLTFRGNIKNESSKIEVIQNDSRFGDPLLENFDYMKLFNSNQLSSCGGIIRTELFEGFNQRYRICEDYDFNLRHALKMKFQYIPNYYTFFYRLRDKQSDLSLSHDPDEQKKHHINNTDMKRNIIKYVKKNTISDEVAQHNKIDLGVLCSL